MIRDFSDFVWSLWQEWKLLLTGGSVVAIAYLYTVVSGKQLSNKVYWCIAALTLLVAFFLSWRKARLDGGSGLVEVNIFKLTDFYRNETDVHARLYVKQYIGKRARFTGTILSVVSHAPFVTVIIIEIGAGFYSRAIRIYRWIVGGGEFKPLRRGTSVTVEGRISTIDGSAIDLTGASLVSVKPEVDHGTKVP